GDDVAGIIFQLVLHLHVGAGKLHAPGRHAGRGGGLGFADQIVGDRPVDSQMDLRVDQTRENMFATNVNDLWRVGQHGVFADSDELAILYRHSTFDNTL